MRKRITIDFVKEYVRTESNGTVEVVSSEYVTNRTPLQIKCSCGCVFQRDWDHLKRGSLYCPECSKKAQSEKSRKSFSEVIKIIEESGLEYVSGKYVNLSSKLTLKCQCGNTFQKSLRGIYKGQIQCPSCGMKSLALKKTKHTIDEVRESLSKKGYILLDEEYLSVNAPMKCMCSKGHLFSIRYGWYLSGTAGCIACARESQKSSGNSNYQGGTSRVSDAIRYALKKWKTSIFELYDYKCAITGETKDLVVHHFESFSNIYYCSLEELGIQPVLLSGKIKDFYLYSDFDAVKNYVVSIHNNSTGILISKKIHLAFHEKHGKQNNTRQEFEDFLMSEYGIQLSEVIRS